MTMATPISQHQDFQSRGHVEEKSIVPRPNVGIGFRNELAAAIDANAKAFDILEFTPENYLGVGGISRALLERAAATHRLLAHGVSLSLGSNDELNWKYIAQIKSLLDEFNIPWFSDHLCYSSIDGQFINDLLPLPFNNKATRRIAERIKRVQDYLERPFLLENISYYMAMPGNMSEAAFLSSVLESADCGLLLDVNNLYVNSQNHKYDPVEFLGSIPLERTVEVHMAGHSRLSNLLVDTHGDRIIPEVYSLLDHVLSEVDVKAIIIERDKAIPPIADLILETIAIRQMCDMRQENVVTQPRLPKKHKTRRHASGSKRKIRAGSLDIDNSSSMLEREFCMATGFIPKDSAANISPTPTTAHLTNQGGIQVYAQLHYWNQIGSLRAMLPQTAKQAGEQWSNIVDRFIESKNGQTYVSCQLARTFVNFLHTECGINDPCKLVIKELAELECTMLQLNLSPVKVIANRNEPLSEISELRDRHPQVNPLLELRQFCFRVPELLNAKTTSSTDFAEVPSEKTHVLIFREPQTLKVSSLYATPVAFAFLQRAATQKLCYTELIESTLTCFNQPMNDETVNSFLKMINLFIQRGVFIGSE